MPRFRRGKNRNVQEWKRDAVNIKAHGVPRAMVVKLPYFEEWKSISVTTGSTTQQVWRLNSLFDPYQTQNTGIVPYGFPIMASLYLEYMVLTATVVFELQSLDAAFGTVVMYFNDAIISRDNEDLINNVGVQNRTYNSPGAGNSNIVKMRRKFHLPDWLGRELDPSKDSAAISANPSQGAYLICQAQNQNTVTGLITFRIKILYTARMFNIDEPTNELA